MFEWRESNAVRQLEPTGETLLLLSEPLAMSPVLALFCPLQNLKKKNLQGFKQSQLAGEKKKIPFYFLTSDSLLCSGVANVADLVPTSAQREKSSTGPR